ncbi:MAG: hypothetical protein ACJAVN_000824 [Roseivirga sp.]|jgi:hypothetical protein
MKEEHYTDLDEVTLITYDTDIYQKVRELTSTKNYEINRLFFMVVQNLNIHYSDQLKELPKGSLERKEFIIGQIEYELTMLG